MAFGVLGRTFCLLFYGASSWLFVEARNGFLFLSFYIDILYDNLTSRYMVISTNYQKYFRSAVLI
jgi:hypothetical protein